MQTGELLTKASIWLALLSYPPAVCLWRFDPKKARSVWTLGCLCFLTHVACAFTFYHHWSHADAYRETARQTAALTGWHWGGGIYFNYLFAICWLADAAWCWLAPANSSRRAKRLQALWHGFFFFMVFNGTIVFGHGPVRWLGVAVCTIVLAAWWRSRHRTADTPVRSSPS